MCSELWWNFGDIVGYINCAELGTPIKRQI